jgi:hypothetical protein
MVCLLAHIGIWNSKDAKLKTTFSSHFRVEATMRPARGYVPVAVKEVQVIALM